MAARWLVRLRRGERGEGPVESVAEGCEKDRRAGMDQIWIVVSAEPERIWVEDGSTARVVTGCRCDGVVEIWRPVQSSQRMILPSWVPRARIPAPLFADPIRARLCIRSGNGTVVS